MKSTIKTRNRDEIAARKTGTQNLNYCSLKASKRSVSPFSACDDNRRPFLALLIFAFCVASSLALYSQTPPASANAQSSEIKIKSRTQERPPGEPDKVILTGDVEIAYRAIKLSADRVDLDMKTKDVTAVGHVTLEMPAEILSAESLSFNMDSDQGSIVKAIGLIQPTIRYQADLIERQADNLYSMGKGEFTSCVQPVPRWKFSFSRANFKKDEYVEMWGAVISVKSVPIFYWPYMRYPLDQERATGFLMPLAGYSQTKGLRFSEGFYWAIARNMDATFSLDYYASKGTGSGLETRYMFPGGTNGNARLYYFTFKTQEGLTTPDDAYIIRWNHSQALPGGFTLVANVDYQSSFEFLREFDNDFMRALVFNKSSQIYLSKSWSTFNLSIRAAQFETSFPMFGTVSLITRSLPQINFDSFKMKFLGPVFLSFSSSYNRWQYGWDNQYKLGTQLKGQDFSLHPSLSLPFNGIRWLSTNFSVDSNLQYSWQSLQPGVGRVEVPVLTSNYALNAELIGPVFYRIWNLGGSGEDGAKPASRLKHIIEPSLSYRYESPTVNADKVFSMYPIFRYHQLTYGLTNHFLLKTGPTPREIFTWGLSQTYYLSPEDSPMSYYPPINGSIPRFSELSSYVRFYPGDKYSFDFSASYNTYFKMFSSIRLGANLGVPSDNLFLNASWYKSSNPYYHNIFYDRHQIALAGGAKIPFLNLDARAEIDYNISDKQMMYSAASLVYHYQCLDFKADVRIYYFREKPEFQYKISLGLGNIGKTTDFLGGAGWD
jgi:LPS-assembly protein